MLFASLIPAKTARAEVDAAAVQHAIDRGIAYLRKTQTKRGGWNEYGSQSCGLTALCTLALLNSGVEKDDPAIVSAMRYLRTFKPKETYSISLQTLVYCHYGAARDLPDIRTNVELLVFNQKKVGRVGSWDYGKQIGSGDPSNSQFALLALGAAKDRGIDVDPIVFQRALKYWVDRQKGGGWSYHGGDIPSGSMTCAGVASVIIARGGLEGGSSQIVGDQITCCGGANVNADPVELGLEWLGRNFTLRANPGGSPMTYFYYLYALERVGRLSGRRFIGGHDWYREGAERLLDLQDGFQGFWSGNGQMAEGNRDVSTSFALLFLSKGKRQVVVGRLQYPSRKSLVLWEQHPDGLRQLVRHVEREWGRDLTWQTIDSDQAEIVDLLQAPVLIISGKMRLPLEKTFTDKLREYVDQGGCIVFEADGGDGCGDASPFERSVRELCAEWYPGTKLDRLPPGHPVWTAARNVDPTLLGDDFWVYGVQACCRTAVFYLPKSLSCRWQLGDVLYRRGNESPAARKQIDASIRIGENIIAYATGRELKDKLDQRTVIRASDVPLPTRGSIRVAQLSVGAGGEEAQRALPNAASLISSQLPIPIAALDDSIGFDSEDLQDIPILWVHGRTGFTFNAAQRQVLADYVRNGGVILGTAICGNKAFAEAFRREIAQTLPKAPLNAVAADHPSLTNTFGGYDITSVTLRTPSAKGITRRSSPPVLEIAELDGVTAVVFSPLDISCALESQNSVQCPGYSTDDAAKIVANIVLYSMQ